VARILRSLSNALRARWIGLVSRVFKAQTVVRAGCDIPLIVGDGALAGGGALLLDDDALERHLLALGDRIGAMPAHIGSRFSQRAAQRFGARLAARYARRLGMRAEVLTDAWYFPIWTELCALIPLRHVARRVARLAAGRPVLIPLDPGPRHYLTYWEPNGLEPFYLAAELRRRGVPVAFISRATPAAQREDTATLRLLPHPAWQPPYLQRSEHRGGGAVIVAAGMRGIDAIVARLGQPLLAASSFAASMPCDFAVADPRVSLPPIELTLPCRPASVVAQPGALQPGTDRNRLDLGAWLAKLLGPPTAAAAAQMGRQARARGLGEAHVCDHMFWESAIVAHAVREAGGRVFLWPHSSNAVHVAARPPGSVARVHCATRSASRAWQARFPEVPCEIVSETILRPCATPRPLTPSQPITVIVIAGSHSLNRLPVLGYDGHTESYRRLFHGLSACAPEIRFACKAKAPWESIEWLRALAGPSTVLRETQEAPTRIDLPNLIYVSVSFGSTALLEGLARGIPCMIVREIPVEDYTAIGPKVFPVGSVEMVLARLRACRDFSAFRAMAEAQLAWYAEETHFEPSARRHRESPEA
jgi:hypothetical protein